jgi:hypothetical protein
VAATPSQAYIISNSKSVPAGDGSAGSEPIPVTVVTGVSGLFSSPAGAPLFTDNPALPWVTADQFKINGDADDAPAINRGITWLVGNFGGGKLLFTGRTYVCASADIIFQSNVMLSGIGPEVSVIQTSGRSMHAANTVPNSGVRIFRAGLEGLRVEASTGVGVDLTQITQALIRDVDIDGADECLNVAGQAFYNVIDRVRCTPTSTGSTIKIRGGTRNLNCFALTGNGGAIGADVASDAIDAVNDIRFFGGAFERGTAGSHTGVQIAGFSAGNPCEAVVMNGTRVDNASATGTGTQTCLVATGAVNTISDLAWRDPYWEIPVGSTYYTVSQPTAFSITSPDFPDYQRKVIHLQLYDTAGAAGGTGTAAAQLYASTSGGDKIIFARTFSDGDYADFTGKNLTAEAGFSSAGLAQFLANVKMQNLPTADPHVVGEIWNNLGIATVSAG